ncbi:LruC domain-containing protein [Cryomorphaceae bacterium]|nr:LruC domain-containing protein [Cryomorphaceae bacterium]
MKKGIVFIFTLFTFVGLQAQVSQDFESGNRNQVRANCWQMNGLNTSGGANSISGNYSARTDNLKKPNGTPNVVSPWVNVSSNTQVSFLFNKTSNSTSNVRIQVIAIGEDQAEQVVWGPQPVNMGNQTGTFNLTLDGNYQFKFEFLSGGGGNSRGLLDDIVIPGTYAADITANPGDGNCPLLEEECPDRDGDGVCDDEDDYPDDPELAYNNYYPGEDEVGALAFEDSWPSYADFDFNDLVVLYRLNTITNADNDAARLVWGFYVQAVGGSKKYAFAIQLDDIVPNQIESVTNQILSGVTQVNLNGTEPGQSKAVIVVFDEVNNVINRPGGSFYNTIPGNPTGVSDTVLITIDLSQPLNPDYFLGSPPYNPFIFADLNRGQEIHMANMPPTDLADPNLFGTGNDDTNPSNGRYYRSVDDFCWAVDIPEYFDYPVEKADIVTAHLKFPTWCQSDGEQFTDWYKAKSGYRDDSNIYD